MKNKSDHIPDAEKMIPLTLEQLKQVQPERPILVLTRCIDEITGEPIQEYAEFEIWDGRCFANADTYDTLENYGKRFLAYPYDPDHIDRAAWEEPCELCGTLNDEIMCQFSKYTAYDQSTTSRYTSAKFCPECGRPLTPEARAMLEKRLRG